MKQLIILTMMMIGWASCAFAQPDAGNQASTTTDTQNATVPANDYDEPFFPSYDADDRNVFYRLSYLLGYRGDPRNTIYMGGMGLAKEDSKSKFQLIVDEKGNVVDCNLLEASTLNNSGKDKIVKNFLLNNRIFDGPGLLNGEPCKSVVLLSVLYLENGNCRMSKICYPLINLLESEDAAPAADSSASS